MQVLAVARDFGARDNLQVEDYSPNHLTLGQGSETWTSRRHLRVTAWDAQGGANVAVEVWASTILVSELSADPHRFFGAIPRRQAWRLAERFVRALGFPNPEAHFRHT
jgi:hypothetical protein